MSTITRKYEEKLPAFGVEVRTRTPCPDDSKWVPLLKSKYLRLKFPNWDAADEYLQAMKTTQPHLELRVVPYDGW